MAVFKYSYSIVEQNQESLEKVIDKLMAAQKISNGGNAAIGKYTDIIGKQVYQYGMNLAAVDAVLQAQHDDIATFESCHSGAFVPEADTACQNLENALKNCHDAESDISYIFPDKDFFPVKDILSDNVDIDTSTPTYSDPGDVSDGGESFGEDTSGIDTVPPADTPETGDAENNGESLGEDTSGIDTVPPADTPDTGDAENTGESLGEDTSGIDTVTPADTPETGETENPGESIKDDTASIDDVPTTSTPETGDVAGPDDKIKEDIDVIDTVPPVATPDVDETTNPDISIKEDTEVIDTTTPVDVEKPEDVIDKGETIGDEIDNITNIELKNIEIDYISDEGKIIIDTNEYLEKLNSNAELLKFYNSVLNSIEKIDSKLEIKIFNKDNLYSFTESEDGLYTVNLSIGSVKNGDMYLSTSLIHELVHTLTKADSKMFEEKALTLLEIQNEEFKNPNSSGSENYYNMLVKYKNQAYQKAADYSNEYLKNNPNLSSNELRQIFNKAYSNYLSETGYDAMETMYFRLYSDAEERMGYNLEWCNASTLYVGCETESDFNKVATSNLGELFSSFATVQIVGDDAMKLDFKANLDPKVYSMLEGMYNSQVGVK